MSLFLLFEKFSYDELFQGCHSVAFFYKRVNYFESFTLIRKFWMWGTLIRILPFNLHVNKIDILFDDILDCDLVQVVWLILIIILDFNGRFFKLNFDTRGIVLVMIISLYDFWIKWLNENILKFLNLWFFNVGM